MAWAGNNRTQAQFLKDCYRCRAPTTIFFLLYFDDNEQGVAVWEIPLCSVLDISDVQFSTPEDA